MESLRAAWKKSTTLVWFSAAVFRAFCNAATTVIGGYLHKKHGMDVFQPLLLFGVFNIVFTGMYAIVSTTHREHIKGAIAAIKPEKSARFGHLLFGAGFRDVGWFLTLAAAQTISSADVWTISMASSLVMTVPAVLLAFGEQPTRVILVSVVGCIVGTTLTTKPDFIFGGKSLALAGTVFALSEGFTDSSTMISTQHLKGVHPAFVLAYSRVILSAFLYIIAPSLYFACFPGRWIKVVNSVEVFMFWILGGFIYSSTLQLSPMANVHLGAQTMGIVSQSVIFWSAVIEVLFLGQSEEPVQYIGMAVVSASVILKPVLDISAEMRHTVVAKMTMVLHRDTKHTELDGKLLNPEEPALISMSGIRPKGPTDQSDGDSGLLSAKVTVSKNENPFSNGPATGDDAEEESDAPLQNDYAQLQESV